MSMTVNTRYFTFRAVWILFFIVRYDGIEGTLCDVDVFLSEEELAMYLDDADVVPDSPSYIIRNCQSQVRRNGTLVYNEGNQSLPLLLSSADPIMISWNTTDDQAKYSISVVNSSMFSSATLSIPSQGTISDYTEGFMIMFPCNEDVDAIERVSLSINITTSSNQTAKVDKFVLSKDCRGNTSETDIKEGSVPELTSLELSHLLSTPIYSSVSMSSSSPPASSQLSSTISTSFSVTSSPSSSMQSSSTISTSSSVSLSFSTRSSTRSSSTVLTSSSDTSFPSISSPPASLSTIVYSSMLDLDIILSSSHIELPPTESSSTTSETPTLSSSSATSEPTTPPTAEGLPLLFYVIVFSPFVAFLIVCICIIVCCLCYIRCKKRKEQPPVMSGFFDNPDEIVHRTCMYDEAPEFENEDKIKKEAMPISLWMTLPWGRTSILPLHTQRLLRMLNIDRRKLTITNTFLRRDNGCLSHGLLLMDSINPMSSMNHGVMMKILTGLGDGSHRDNILRFIDQATLMQGLEHPNILPVLGMSLEDNCVPIVIYPIMEYGNLHSFIELCRVSPESCPLNPFGTEFRINFALQITSAVVFLNEKGIVHQDLALRNCWLDTNYQVKVSDGALIQEFYPECYSKIKGALRPVKWSALETLQEGLLTTHSNVWSHGIVLWEVFNMALPPYPDVPNGSIISHLMMDERLPQPEDCPAQLYRLMTDCWKTRAEERPRMAAIHRTLASLTTELPPLVYPAVPVSTTPTYFSPRTTEPTFTTFFSETQNSVPVTAEGFSLSSTNDLPPSRHSGGASSGFNEGVVKRHSGGTKKRSSGHLSASSIGRGGDHLSLSFSILSANDDGGSSGSSSDNEGEGSFPSTLRSTKSTTTGTVTTGTVTTDNPTLVSESMATLQPISPMEEMLSYEPPNISPDVCSKASTMDDSVSSSMVNATTAQSGTDRSSFYSTGIDSISTTFSTPLPSSAPNSNQIHSYELKPLGMGEDSQSYKSRPVDTSSASPLVGKRTDSGIRSDEETSSSDGHLGSSNAPQVEPVILRNSSNSIDRTTTTSIGSSTGATPRDSMSHNSRTSFGLGLGLGDMSSELMAAFDKFGTTSFKS